MFRTSKSIVSATYPLREGEGQLGAISTPSVSSHIFAFSLFNILTQKIKLAFRSSDFFAETAFLLSCFDLVICQRISWRLFGMLGCVHGEQGLFPIYFLAGLTENSARNPEM